MATTVDKARIEDAELLLGNLIIADTEPADAIRLILRVLDVETDVQAWDLAVDDEEDKPLMKPIIPRGHVQFYDDAAPISQCAIPVPGPVSESTPVCVVSTETHRLEFDREEVAIHSAFTSEGHHITWQ